MKKANPAKGVKKPITLEEVLDQIVPKRQVEVTAKKLKEYKSKPDLRTRAVNSKLFGFEKSLTMFVLPKTTKAEIIEKFNVKFGINQLPTDNLRRIQV